MTWKQTLNEDWVKTLSWDLPTTFEGLADYLGFPVNQEQQNVNRWMAFRRLVDLPTWAAAPIVLVTEINAYLGIVAGRPDTSSAETRSWDEGDHPRGLDVPRNRAAWLKTKNASKATKRKGRIDDMDTDIWEERAAWNEDDHPREGGRFSSGGGGSGESDKTKAESAATTGTPVKAWQGGGGQSGLGAFSSLHMHDGTDTHIFSRDSHTAGTPWEHHGTLARVVGDKPGANGKYTIAHIESQGKMSDGANKALDQAFNSTTKTSTKRSAETELAPEFWESEPWGIEQG